MNKRGYTLISVLLCLLIFSSMFLGTLTLFNHSLLVLKINSVNYDLARASQALLEEAKVSLKSNQNAFNPTQFSTVIDCSLEMMSIGEDNNLYLAKASSSIGQGSSLNIYRVFYINSIYNDSFYYIELSLTP